MLPGLPSGLLPGLQPEPGPMLQGLPSLLLSGLQPEPRPLLPGLPSGLLSGLQPEPWPVLPGLLPACRVAAQRRGTCRDVGLLLNAGAHVGM